MHQIVLAKFDKFSKLAEERKKEQAADDDDEEEEQQAAVPDTGFVF